MTQIIGETVRQKFIRDTIDWYKKNYPDKYSKLKDHSKKVRNTRANVYGYSKDMEARWVMTLPIEVVNIFNHFLKDPKFLDEDKEFLWFRSNFPEFSSSEKY